MARSGLQPGIDQGGDWRLLGGDGRFQMLSIVQAFRGRSARGAGQDLRSRSEGGGNNKETSQGTKRRCRGGTEGSATGSYPSRTRRWSVAMRESVRQGPRSSVVYSVRSKQQRR